MDRLNIWTMARKELRDALKNRWLVAFTIAFAGLALALSMLAQPGAAQLRLSSYGRTAAGLINLVLLFVPLIGLTIGTSGLASDRETGALAYLLAQPVSHAEVLLGKFIGVGCALLTSLILGFGLAGIALTLQHQSTDPLSFVVTVFLACLLALAMLSMGLLIAVIVRKTSTALTGSLFAWLVFVFVGDLGIMGAAIVTQLPIQLVFWVASLNPLQMFKMAAILNMQANLDVLGPVGNYASQQYGGGLLVLLIGGLLLWIVIPLGLALVVFSGRNLITFRKRIA